MNARSALEFSPGAAGPVLGHEEADPLAWRDHAACQYVDSEIFFPEQGGSTREAKSVCRNCPVRADCLEFALKNNERFGIWGGLSERERRPVNRTVAAVIAPAPRMCRKGLHVVDEADRGTDGGCRACKRAADARRWRKQHPEALGRGRTAEPRERGDGGRFAPQPDKKLAA